MTTSLLKKLSHAFCFHFPPIFHLFHLYTDFSSFAFISRIFPSVIFSFFHIFLTEWYLSVSISGGRGLCPTYLVLYFILFRIDLLKSPVATFFSVKNTGTSEENKALIDFTVQEEEAVTIEMNEPVSLTFATRSAQTNMWPFSVCSHWRLNNLIT